MLNWLVALGNLALETTWRNIFLLATLFGFSGLCQHKVIVVFHSENQFHPEDVSALCGALVARHGRRANRTSGHNFEETEGLQMGLQGYRHLVYFFFERYWG